MALLGGRLLDVLPAGDDPAKFGVRLTPPLGWQPSRSLSDRAEAERAFALAERLASVNAAAIQLGTTWPSLCKAIAATAWARPPATPEAVRQEAIAAAVSALVSPPPTPQEVEAFCGWLVAAARAAADAAKEGGFMGFRAEQVSAGRRGCWSRCTPHSGWPERSGPRSGDGKGCGLRPCSNPTVA